jgi:hypothetical protein
MLMTRCGSATHFLFRRQTWSDSKLAAVRVHQGLEQEASNSRPFYAHRHRRFHGCMSSCFEVGQRCACASSMCPGVFLHALTLLFLTKRILVDAFPPAGRSTSHSPAALTAIQSSTYIDAWAQHDNLRSLSLSAEPRGVRARGPRNTDPDHRCLPRYRSTSVPCFLKSDARRL